MNKQINRATATAFANDVIREIAAQRNANKPNIIKDIEQSAAYKSLQRSLREREILGRKIQLLSDRIRKMHNGCVKLSTHSGKPDIGINIYPAISNDAMRDMLIVAVNIEGLTPEEAKKRIFKQYV